MNSYSFKEVSLKKYFSTEGYFLTPGGIKQYPELSRSYPRVLKYGQRGAEKRPFPGLLLNPFIKVFNPNIQ
jgi:hypothetical protein